MFGFILYILLFIGENSEYFADNSTVMWIGMLLSILFLYGLVIGIVNNITNLELGLAGLKLSSLFIGLIIPIGLFSYNYFYKEAPIKYSSLLEKNNIKLITNPNACYGIKYGTFTNGIDTIIRYSEKHINYELIKTTNQQFTNRIKWLDSCSYLRLEKNNSVSRYIRLGNFESDIHFMYSKPASVHNINEESYEMILSVD